MAIDGGMLTSVSVAGVCPDSNCKPSHARQLQPCLDGVQCTGMDSAGVYHLTVRSAVVVSPGGQADVLHVDCSLCKLSPDVGGV